MKIPMLTYLTHNRAGKINLAAIIIIVILAIVAVLAWLFLLKPNTPNPQPVAPKPPAKQEVKLPPLPEKFYDLSGVIKEVNTTSFTITARLRTDKNTIAEGFKDVVLTINFDSATKFEKQGVYTGTGQVPATTKATSKDLAPGLGVDIHSRENIRNATSFMASIVTIKPPVKK